VQNVRVARALRYRERCAHTGDTDANHPDIERETIVYKQRYTLEPLTPLLEFLNWDT